MAAAAAAIIAGTGDGDRSEEESDGREVEGGRADVKFGTELEKI